MHILFPAPPRRAAATHIEPRERARTMVVAMSERPLCTQPLFSASCSPEARPSALDVTPRDALPRSGSEEAMAAILADGLFSHDGAAACEGDDAFLDGFLMEEACGMAGHKVSRFAGWRAAHSLRRVAAARGVTSAPVATRARPQRADATRRTPRGACRHQQLIPARGSKRPPARARCVAPRRVRARRASLLRDVAPRRGTSAPSFATDAAPPTLPPPWHTRRRLLRRRRRRRETSSRNLTRLEVVMARCVAASVSARRRAVSASNAAPETGETCKVVARTLAQTTSGLTRPFAAAQDWLLPLRRAYGEEAECVYTFLEDDDGARTDEEDDAAVGPSRPRGEGALPSPAEAALARERASAARARATAAEALATEAQQRAARAEASLARAAASAKSAAQQQQQHAPPHAPPPLPLPRTPAVPAPPHAMPPLHAPPPPPPPTTVSRSGRRVSRTPHVAALLGAPGAHAAAAASAAAATSAASASLPAPAHAPTRASRHAPRPATEKENVPHASAAGGACLPATASTTVSRSGKRTFGAMAPPQHASAAAGVAAPPAAAPPPASAEPPAKAPRRALAATAAASSTAAQPAPEPPAPAPPAPAAPLASTVAAAQTALDAWHDAAGRKCRRGCFNCGLQKTPQWRMGPAGAKTLCNACGVRYRKDVKDAAAAAAAAGEAEQPAAQMEQ
jgi:hypothetical protein